MHAALNPLVICECAACLVALWTGTYSSHLLGLGEGLRRMMMMHHDKGEEKDDWIRW